MLQLRVWPRWSRVIDALKGRSRKAKRRSAHSVLQDCTSIRFAAIFTVFVVSAPTTTDAATFTATATIGPLGCSERDSSSRSASVQCPSFVTGALSATAFARSGEGTTSAYASAISLCQMDGVGIFVTPSESLATLSDTITAVWTDSGDDFEGYFSFEIDLLGAVVSGATTSAFVTSAILVGSNSVYSYDSRQNGAPNFTGRSAVARISRTSPFRIVTKAEARACNLVDSGETCFSEADLGNSLRLTGLSFFDASGADVTSSLTVTSGSGFDYIAGAQPHDRVSEPNIIPLPASLWFLLAGVGGFVALSRRSA